MLKFENIVKKDQYLKDLIFALLKSHTFSNADLENLLEPSVIITTVRDYEKVIKQRYELLEVEIGKTYYYQNEQRISFTVNLSFRGKKKIKGIDMEIDLASLLWLGITYHNIIHPVHYSKGYGLPS